MTVSAAFTLLGPGVPQSYALVEARVVRLWERDDELAGALVCFGHLDAGFAEAAGRQQRHQLEQQVWLRLEELGYGLAHRALKRCWRSERAADFGAVLNDIRKEKEELRAEASGVPSASAPGTPYHVLVSPQWR